MAKKNPSKVLNSIDEYVGNTPMVKLNHVSKGLECELLAKCDFFNPGGSVKDRIGLRMIDDAEKSGRIKPGDTLIEPTSGNTGIGLSLVAAVRGYKMIITLPEKMSKEKVDVLKALGAQVVRTPTEARYDSPESLIGVAQRLNKEIPNSHILDQYANDSNPLAHYDGTAEEILEQCGGHLDMVVMTAGTGGTITGVAKKLKEKVPGIVVVGVDPYGSILAQPETLNDFKRAQSYKVEGIGYDFIPKVLEREYVDRWVKTDDQESFLMARRLIREEGLLVGGTSGSAVVAALQACKELKKGQKCVVLLADSVRNYMSKFLSEDWMIDNGFMPPLSAPPQKQESWMRGSVKDLTLRKPVVVPENASVRDAVKLLSENYGRQGVFLNALGGVEGMVSEAFLVSMLKAGRASPETPAKRFLFKLFRKVKTDTSILEASRIFEYEQTVLVMDERDRLLGTIDRMDLLRLVTSRSTSKL